MIFGGFGETMNDCHRNVTLRLEKFFNYGNQFALRGEL